MTPEEKAVVQAAIEAHQIGREPSVAQQNILRTAVHQLIFNCPECNQGGHTCPGDGNWIAHGESDCGQHDECQCSRTERAYCHAENCHGGADIKEWHPATFADCLAGDRIRIGDQESDVLWTTGPQRFHVRNREWTGDDGKVRDHTVGRWDHIELRMDLSANPGRREYVPFTECEILCTPERAAALMLNAKPVDK
jgi:hypothetical protein